MSRLAKNTASKNNETSPKNASPVCYLESDEVRPEYHSDNQTKRDINQKPKPKK